MENINLINGYKIKILYENNHKIVEELCEKCSDYYILHDDILPSKEEIDEIFNTLPPNKNYFNVNGDFDDEMLMDLYI